MQMALMTEPGDPRTPNEDYAAVSSPVMGLGGALVLLDGVTPPAQDVGCRHDVPWYVTRLGGALLELTGARRDLTLAQCLREAISRTARAHSSTCDLSHARTPQATVAVARWSEGPDGLVEYLVLSDSVLLLENSEVTAVRDTRLDELLSRVRGMPRERRVETIESLRNAEGGFYTAAADPDVARHAVTGTLPRAQARSLAALTDGASRWTEVFGLGDWAALHGLLRQSGPRRLLEEVRRAERADPKGARHPRGKTHDDATAVFVPL